jgi:hypothetical protein
MYHYHLVTMLGCEFLNVDKLVGIGMLNLL